MDVRLRLAVSAGEIVMRQALLDDVWARRVVADEVLSRTIAELRTIGPNLAIAARSAPRGDEPRRASGDRSDAEPAG